MITKVTFGNLPVNEVNNIMGLTRHRRSPHFNVKANPFPPPPQIAKVIYLSQQPKRYDDPEYLSQKYVEERLTTNELAALTGSSKTTILKYLKLHGIPIRGSGKVLRKRPGFGLGYGSRIVLRRERAFKREQENIHKMKELREKGFSYWKIADILNSMKVPTQTRRGKWHAKTVHQILSAQIPQLLSQRDSTPDNKLQPC